MKTYDITSDYAIALYGYNVYTIEQVQCLREKGFQKIYIIDRNAENIRTDLNVQMVVHVSEIKEYQEICIWVMLQNAMQHFEVAKELYQQGVRKIIFAPLVKGFFDNDKKYKMIALYNYILWHDYEQLLEVPYISDVFFELRKMSVIERERRFLYAQQGGYIFAWVPLECLHTSMIEPLYYADIPISNFKPYYDLFDYLDGKDIDIEEYIVLFGKINKYHGTNEQRMTVINKRKYLKEYLDYEFNGGMDYFVVSAPKVKWNKKGYFNLCEGQHRCVYLSKRGLDKLPVRMTLDDYDNANKYYGNNRKRKCRKEYCFKNVNTKNG